MGNKKEVGNGVAAADAAICNYFVLRGIDPDEQIGVLLLNDEDFMRVKVNKNDQVRSTIAVKGTDKK